jgi:hypothetical protein
VAASLEIAVRTLIRPGVKVKFWRADVCGLWRKVKTSGCSHVDFEAGADELICVSWGRSTQGDTFGFFKLDKGRRIRSILKTRAKEEKRNASRSRI